MNSGQTLERLTCQIKHVKCKLKFLPQHASFLQQRNKHRSVLHVTLYVLCFRVTAVAHSQICNRGTELQEWSCVDVNSHLHLCIVHACGSGTGSFVVHARRKSMGSKTPLSPRDASPVVAPTPTVHSSTVSVGRPFWIGRCRWQYFALGSL